MPARKDPRCLFDGIDCLDSEFFTAVANGLWREFPVIADP